MRRLLKSLLIPHHENTYKPHLIRRHGLAFVLAVVFLMQTASGLNAPKQEVLGIASNITHGGLLSGTNAERTSRGLKALQANSKLNSSAQSKAQHMVNNNYWSHNAPDGTTPWYFFNAAGYAYVGAGENLAYGFDTSGGVINGWMNSSGHRANILDSSYEQVGFGIANSNNFQGAPNTVVVAHYGDPYVAPPPPKPKPKPQTVATQPSTTSNSSTPTPQKKEEKPKETKKEEPKQEEPAASETEMPATQESPALRISDEAKRISNLEAIINGQAHWSLYASAFLLSLMALVYAYRHVLFIHNAIIKGEKFVAHHPLLEAGLIYIALWLILSGTHGVVF